MHAYSAQKRPNRMRDSVPPGRGHWSELRKGKCLRMLELGLGPPGLRAGLRGMSDAQNFNGVLSCDTPHDLGCPRFVVERVCNAGNRANVRSLPRAGFFAFMPKLVRSRVTVAGRSIGAMQGCNPSAAPEAGAGGGDYSPSALRASCASRCAVG
jgi:hypothetical protein